MNYLCFLWVSNLEQESNLDVKQIFYFCVIYPRSELYVEYCNTLIDSYLYILKQNIVWRIIHTRDGLTLTSVVSVLQWKGFFFLFPFCFKQYNLEILTLIVGLSMKRRDCVCLSVSLGLDVSVFTRYAATRSPHKITSKGSLP